MNEEIRIQERRRKLGQFMVLNLPVLLELYLWFDFVIRDYLKCGYFPVTLLFGAAFFIPMILITLIVQKNRRSFFHIENRGYLLFFTFFVLLQSKLVGLFLLPLLPSQFTSPYSYDLEALYFGILWIFTITEWLSFGSEGLLKKLVKITKQQAADSAGESNDKIPSVNDMRDK